MRGMRRCALVALYSVVSTCLLGACVFVDTESMVATEVARRLDEYATRTAEAPTAEPTATFTPEPTATPTALPTPDATATWVVSQRTLDAAAASARGTAEVAERTREVRQACRTLSELYGDRNAIVDECNLIVNKEWHVQEFQPLVDMLDELTRKTRQSPLPASAEHLRSGFLAWCELNHQLIDLYGAYYRTGAESYYLQAEATRRQWNAVGTELHSGISDYCSW
jgi:hypothetical protein